MTRALTTAAGLWLCFVGGCGRAPETPMVAPAKSNPPPTNPATPKVSTDAFQQQLDAAVAELNAKNEANTAWGLGSFDRWDIDQDVGNLVFTKADGTKVITRAQIVGSFSTASNTWLWAWDNPSIADGLKDHARQVQAYGEQHGIDQLTTAKWDGTEADAWAMTALAVKLTNAQGAYRGPAGKAFVFMTFDNVQATSPADQN